MRLNSSTRPFCNPRLAWRSSLFVAAASILVIGCVLGVLFWGGGKAEGNYKDDLKCGNASCSYDRRDLRPAGETKPPFTCPDCGQKSLYLALQCQDCGQHTPKLPPASSWICGTCRHQALAQLDAAREPHPCPSCGKKDFLLAYQCPDCRFIFGQARVSLPAAGSEDEIDPSSNGYAIPCPHCQGPRARPLTRRPVVACAHCSSPNLVAITPRDARAGSGQPAQQMMAGELKVEE